MKISVDFTNNVVEFIEDSRMATKEITDLVINKLHKLGFFESGIYLVEFVGLTFLIKRASLVK